MMKKQVLFLALAATLGAAPAHAIYINDHAFVANGGDMSNVQGSYANAFNRLRTASQAAQFSAVGKIGSCTATWLGVEGDYAWFLTSATCVPNKTQLVQPLASSYDFKIDQGYSVAVGGTGAMSFVHPNRLAPPAGVSTYGTNIALVRLKRNWANNNLAPTLGPLIYDGNSESNVPVTFVSYGTMGVNSEKIVNTMARRVRAESVIDGVDDAGYGLFHAYKAGSPTHWARTTPMDRGGAWWQQHDGRWQVVGTTSDNLSPNTKGLRISPYASWINELFPAARLVSEGNASVFDDAEVTNSNQFLIDYGRNVAFHKSDAQPDVILSGVIGVSGSTITVPVTNVETGVTSSIVVHPSRPYYIGTKGLTVKVDKEAAAALPSGVWKGRLSLDVVTPAGTHPDAKLDLDIAVVGAPQEGFDYRSKNLATTNTSVYFTVPVQATAVAMRKLDDVIVGGTSASGPTNGYRNTKLGHSTITVQGRNAITQQPVELKLRAQRVRGGTCAPVEMNNAMPCGTNQSSVLNIWFDPIDNPSLANGTRYAAKFNVQARTFGNSSVNQIFPVSVDVNLLP